MIKKARIFQPGDIVQHFKYNPDHPNKYLYRIIGTAVHTETGEKLMVRQCTEILQYLHAHIKCSWVRLIMKNIRTFHRSIVS